MCRVGSWAQAHMQTEDTYVISHLAAISPIPNISNFHNVIRNQKRINTETYDIVRQQLLRNSNQLNSLGLLELIEKKSVQ